MTARTGHQSARRRLGVAAVLAVLLVGVVPGTAGAVGELLGGATPGTAVALPPDVADLDGAVGVTNAGVPGGTGARNSTVAPYWNNVAWYAFTPSVTGVVAIWTDSDSVWIPSLEVWTDAGVLLQENTDATGYEGAVVISVTAGQRYSIGVGGGSYTNRGTAMLRFAAGNPVAPIVTVTPGDGSVALSWTQPPGTPAAMAYRGIRGGMYYGATGETPFVTTATALTMTGLTNGQTYLVSVEARNPFGALVASVPVSVTPKAPSTLTATATPATPVSGEPSSVTAAVSSHGAPVASGSVAIALDGVSLGSVNLVGGAVGPLPLGVLPAGDHTLVMEYTGTSSIAPSTLSLTITVARRAQSIDFAEVNPAFRVYGFGIVLHATSSRGLPVTFSTNGTGICSIRDGNTLDLVGVGTCVVTATQVGDSETQAAEVSQSFEVDKRTQTVSLEPIAPMVYGQDGVRVVADSALGLPVTVEATGDCEMVGDLVLTTGAGTCTVTATQPGDEHHHVAPPVSRTVPVAKRAQSIDFAEVNPAFRVYGFGIVLHATSSRGLPVTFSTNGTGICSVRDGNPLDLVGVGTCVVTATQVGDSETQAAEVSQTFEVDKRTQTVSLEPIAPMVYGQDGVRVVADSALGLPVTVEATGDCEMVGDLVLTTGAGTCTVTATQPGDEHHHVAPPVSRTVLVAKRAQTLTLSDLPALAQGVRQMPFRAESSVGLPVTVAASGACGYADGVVSTSAIGICTVTVEAAGDSDTEPVTATRSVTVVNAAAEVFVHVTGRAGDLVTSVPFVAEGTQLLPGSTMTVTAHSDPVLVGSTTVTASGSGRVATTLPTLSPGTHRLVVAGVGLDGATVQSEVTFSVSAAGTITWIGTAPAARSSGSSLAATGADVSAAGLLAALWLVTGAALLLVRRAVVVRRRRVAVA